MKKMRVISVVLSMLLVFCLSTCVVSAADGDLLNGWEGADLVAKDNGSDQGGIRDKDMNVIHLGSEDSTSAAACIVGL